jgi:flagellar M-ring protein FliF
MGGTRLAIFGGVTAAVVLFFVLFVGRLTQGPMALLFGGLDLQDSAQIVAKLEAQKIPYELRGNGTEILVPEDQALRLRLSLAQDGVPSGGTIGYEIFDKSESLGTTNFVQNLNHLRALEGEIGRTIRAIDGVANARVHLVLPRREAFSRDTQEPSASILLKMRGATRLEKPQVLAIQNLIAAAVPGLKASRISIVDDKGTLLARSTDDPGGAANAPTNVAEIRTGIEERLKREVETLLEKSVGAGSVRAEVTADVDFDRITTNQESFDPDGQVVRSTQSVAENASNTDQEAGSGSVSVGNNLPEAQGAKGGTKSNSSNGRQEETVNYEISKTVRTQIREAGVIRRLSVAVLVDGVRGTKDGAKTYAARGKEELDQLAALVRSAIGFDQKRGDSVEVVNMPFASVEELPPPIEELNLFGLGKQDLFRIAEMLVLGVVALLVLLLVVRPLLSRALAPRPPGALPGPGTQQLTDGTGQGSVALTSSVGGELTALSSDVPRNNIEAMIDIARVEGQVKASSLKKIGEIVDKHPEEAVAIVRNWLYQDS